MSVLTYNESAVVNYIISIMAYGQKNKTKLWWSMKDLEKELRYMFGFSVRRSSMLRIIEQLDREGRLEYLGTSKRKKFRLVMYVDEEVIDLDEVNIEEFGLTEKQINAIFEITPTTARVIVNKCKSYIDRYRSGILSLEGMVSEAIADYKTMYGQRARKEMSFMLYVLGYMVSDIKEHGIDKRDLT